MIKLLHSIIRVSTRPGSRKQCRYLPVDQQVLFERSSLQSFLSKIWKERLLQKKGASYTATIKADDNYRRNQPWQICLIYIYIYIYVYLYIYIHIYVYIYVYILVSNQVIHCEQYL